jgi:hypothetical protein
MDDAKRDKLIRRIQERLPGAEVQTIMGSVIVRSDGTLYAVEQDICGIRVCPADSAIMTGHWAAAHAIRRLLSYEPAAAAEPVDDRPDQDSAEF